MVTSSPWVCKFTGHKYSLAVRGTVYLVNLNRRLYIQFQHTKNHDSCQIHNIVHKKGVALILESKALLLILKQNANPLPQPFVLNS